MNYTSGYDGRHITGTPLHSAAANGRHQVPRLLLSRGALSDMEKMDWEGRTPFSVPLGVPDLPGIHRRRSYPRDANFPFGVGGDKATPLHRAAHNWNTAAIQALLHLGADPDATDEHGRHPLHWAAIGRCLEDYPKSRRISHTWSSLRAARIKEVLLDAGADATVRDAQGRTAAEIEEAMSQELRRGREKNLEELARPRPEFGRGRGRGFGRGWWTSPAPAPAPREAGGVDVSAGAGYGR